MANVFNSVKGLHPKRNKFSADTYRNDFTAPLGVNIPCYLQEVPPATRIKCSASALVRLQALIAPVMDNIDYYTHFWQIPYRLLENDRFTAFISGEIAAEDYDALFCTPFTLAQGVVDEINALYPSMSGNDRVALYERIFYNGSLMDFLGYDGGLFPTAYYDGDPDLLLEEGEGNNTTKLNWRGFIAYFMLHANWYMNENVPYFNNFIALVDNLVKEQDLPSFCDLLVKTAHMHGDYSCAFLPHGWEKDYFTSALPNVQSGDPVTLPIGGEAPVTVDVQNAYLRHTSDSVGVYVESDGTLNGSNDLTGSFVTGYVGGDMHAGSKTVVSVGGVLSANNKDGGTAEGLSGVADLSEATAITINELRFANALQVFKERQMRFGKRRQEYYKGFFDVVPEDLRLQLPKYLGGGRIPINIADIEQTSQTSGTSALGHLAGKATAVAGGFAGFSTFCSEESVIIGIAFAMPHITYANALSRFKMKTNDIYDYFNPSFEHLGEQAIKNVEVFAASTTPDGEFGYTPRYNEYRFHMNEMHGAFKDSLSFWSLGRIFGDQPALNADFVYMQPAVFDRIFAVSGQPNMVVSMLFHVRTIKPVSKYGTPMLLA